MSITFVHTADWHIGRGFGGFPEDVKALLRDARLEVVGRLAALAREAGARHVLVAGDAFDSATLPDREVIQLLERLAAAQPVVWHLLPGNHDPLRGHLWERVRRVGLPANVRIVDEARPIELERGVFLLPAPLRAKAVADDPSRWMDEGATPDGAIRIGLAHGPVRGFGSNPEASGRGIISPDRARRARLDYLALGDWHGRLKIDAATWYAGTPEPDNFVDNDAGSALVVRIAGAGAPPVVTPHRTARFRWMRHSARLGTVSTIDDVLRGLDGSALDPAQTLVRLTLEGHVAATDYARLDSLLDRLAARYRHVDLRADALVIEGKSDTTTIPDDPELAAVVARLEALAGSADDPQRVLAGKALARLAVLANEQSGEPDGATSGRGSS